MRVKVNISSCAYISHGAMENKRLKEKKKKMIFLLFIICGIQRESLFFIYRFFTYILFLYNAFSYIYNKIDIIKIIFFLSFFVKMKRRRRPAQQIAVNLIHSFFLFASLQTVFVTSQSHFASVLKHHRKKSNNSLSCAHIISARIWCEQEETDSVYNEKFYCDKKIYFVILLNRVVMMKGLQ